MPRPVRSRPARSRSVAAQIGIRLIVPVLLVAIWQVESMLSADSRISIPSPTAVIAGFGELWASGTIQDAIPVSLGRAGLGLMIGGAIGIAFGALNGVSRLMEHLFDLPFQVIRVIPFIALLPLFTISLGIGDESKIALIAIACLFPAYLNAFAAVKRVDPKIIEAGRVFGLSRFQVTTQIVLPAALPGILVGVRYATGIALLALIVAEQINASAGVGHIIWVAQNAVRIDLILVGIVIYALLGIAVDLLMKAVEWAALPWERKHS